MNEKQIDLDAMRALAKEKPDTSGGVFSLSPQIILLQRVLRDAAAEIEQLRKERDTLRAALTRITTEHCAYKLDSNRQYDIYDIGVVDGHRCAASLARAALAAQGDKPHE